MTITIAKYDLDSPELRELYDVTFFDEEIETLVTNRASMVTAWIGNTESIHRRRLHKLVVGLDIEWCPNTRPGSSNPVATLQLCVGRSCLIIQLLYARKIPKSLIDFLADDDYTFVGVGIEGDVEKLEDDYGLEVSNVVDLRVLARARFGKVVPRNVGLRELAAQVLGTEFAKPKKITMSRWDKAWLSPAQVTYACVDAFVSFEIGRILKAWKFED
ncbi:Werner Syndrome-like exonuclease [Morus notabilis]|uniref:Werner Syndrome-like exonuclease n=1 Tax=Morus notabilis TaxID=981085 RepID=W9SHU8_9ROSA|nr:Werner Syndrome-like exonuclease [Morus notabilis]EXC30699.1 Werner Syndrome-like exonuclease [Morus notabilis]